MAPRKAGHPRWTVHVEFLDGALEDAVGDPTVVNGCLRVATEDDDEGVIFEALYPLTGVRVWWCDYTGGDGARANAHGSRHRLRAPGWDVGRLMLGPGGRE